MLVGADLTRVYTSDQVDEGQTPTPGDLFFAPSGKIYKFLEYKEGTAAVDGVAGEVAYYYTLDGYKLKQVTSDLSDSIELGAGVLQANMSDGEFGWLQIKGEATLSIALTAGADGDPLTPTGAGDGTLDVVANDAASGYLSHVCAYAGDISDLEIVCDLPF